MISIVMKFIFSLLLIVSLSFSQSLKITSPTNGQSFRLNDIIEIKWEAESRVNITGEIVLYWSETDRIIDFKVIDRVSVAEKSYSWFLEKSDFINSDGEIFIIARWKGVDSIVGIEIGPIIRKSRIGDISFTSKISGVQVSLNEKFEGTTPFTKKEVGLLSKS